MHTTGVFVYGMRSFPWIAGRGVVVVRTTGSSPAKDRSWHIGESGTFRVRISTPFYGTFHAVYGTLFNYCHSVLFSIFFFKTIKKPINEPMIVLSELRPRNSGTTIRKESSLATLRGGLRSHHHAGIPRLRSFALPPTGHLAKRAVQHARLGRAGGLEP